MYRKWLDSYKTKHNQLVISKCPGAGEIMQTLLTHKISRYDFDWGKIQLWPESLWGPLLVTLQDLIRMEEDTMTATLATMTYVENS